MSLAYNIAEHDLHIINISKDIKKKQKAIERKYISLKTKNKNPDDITNQIKLKLLEFYLTNILDSYKNKYYTLFQLLEYINSLDKHTNKDAKKK